MRHPWADRSPQAVGLVSGTWLDFHLHLLPYPENFCAVNNLCNCTQQLWPESQGPKHFNSVASRQIPVALQNKDGGDQAWFLGCEFIPHLNTRTCTLQTQQELGRPHPTPKVTSAYKVRNIPRREEGTQEDRNSLSSEVTSHLPEGSLQGGPAHMDPSPPGFLPDHSLDHALYSTS